MKEITKITELLGGENEKRLKDGITDLLLQRVENDLEDMCIYLIDFEHLLEEVGKEIELAAKEKMMKMYIEKLDAKLKEIK